MNRATKPGSRSLVRAAREAQELIDPADQHGLAAAVITRTGRLAVNKTEAAAGLGVSVEFFDEHVAPEVRSVQRGRRRLYPVVEIMRWLHESSTRAGHRGMWMLPTCALAAECPRFLPGFLS